jgi:dephospho-CoA kinase
MKDNKIKFIGISGKIGSGKDTSALELRTIINNHFKNEVIKPDVYIRYFADPLKEITSILSGVEINKLYTQEGKNIYVESFEMTTGEMLQKIGTDVMRNHFDNDIWIKALLNNYYTYPKNTIFILPDVRFENEYNLVNENGIMIRINGDPALVRANSNRDLNHISETALDNADFEYVINNNGTLTELIEKLEEIFSEIKSDLI